MSSCYYQKDFMGDDISLNFVNCNKIGGFLYKYMPASRVMELLNDKEHKLAFVSPVLWQDPYETKFLDTNYSNLNGYKQPKIFCFCARMDHVNQEASWKIYKKAEEPLLRLKIKTDLFIGCITDFAKTNNCKLYFSKVDYRLPTKEIDNLHLPSSKYYHEFFDKFDECQYVRIMSLKRRAFKYENEYRIFIVPQEDMPMFNGYLLYIPIDIKIIEGITINPANKLEDNFMSRLNKARYNASVKFIRNEIKSISSEITFSRSILYESAKKVPEIIV